MRRRVNRKKVNGKTFRFKSTRTVQLRSLVYPSDALLVSGDQKGNIESETHVGVREGRWAKIGQALYSPFQIPAGSKFIGTFMLDFDKTKVSQDKLVNVFATLFIRTRRYGGRTAQEGLIEPQILAVIDVPYECVSSYDLYEVVKPVLNSSTKLFEEKNWPEAVQNYINQSLKEVKGTTILNPQILQETELLAAIEGLTTEFRVELSREGIDVEEVKAKL